MSNKSFVAATNNAHKLVELCTIFEAAGIHLHALSESGFSGEIIENGATFEENALIKANTVCKATGLATIADDSGLCVEALGGAPGIYSARFGAPECVSDADRRRFLLQKMEGVIDRRAHFACVIACAFPNGETVTAYGECRGSIALSERGAGGFGYDSLFIPENSDRTLAEFSSEEKNRISHRSAAIRAFTDALQEYLTKRSTLS